MGPRAIAHPAPFQPPRFGFAPKPAGPAGLGRPRVVRGAQGRGPPRLRQDLGALCAFARCGRVGGRCLLVVFLLSFLFMFIICIVTMFCFVCLILVCFVLGCFFLGNQQTLGCSARCPFSPSCLGEGSAAIRQNAGSSRARGRAGHEPRIPCSVPVAVAMGNEKWQKWNAPRSPFRGPKTKKRWFIGVVPTFTSQSARIFFIIHWMMCRSFRACQTRSLAALSHQLFWGRVPLLKETTEKIK